MSRKPAKAGAIGSFGGAQGDGAKRLRAVLNIERLFR